MDLNMLNNISDNTKKLFPYATDKMVVDFINCIYVAKDLNHQKSHSTGFSHIKSEISGKASLEQAMINDNLIGGLDACRHLILDLQQNAKQHSRAIEYVIQRLSTSEEVIEKFYQEFADFKTQVNNELKEIKSHLKDLHFKINSNEIIDILFDRWNADGLIQFSPMARCYYVLDYIYWSGVQINKDNLIDKLVKKLKDDLGTDRYKDIPLNRWLEIDGSLEAEEQKLLRFQGDWTFKAPESYSNAFVATQWQHLDKRNREEYKSIPCYMIDIDRVTRRMADEVLTRRKLCLN